MKAKEVQQPLPPNNHNNPVNNNEYEFHSVWMRIVCGVEVEWGGVVWCGVVQCDGHRTKKTTHININ